MKKVKKQRFVIGFKAAIFKKNRILIVSQNDERSQWELPGGGMNIGEEEVSSLKVLKRELAEELGTEVKITINKPLLSVVSKYSYGPRVGEYDFHLVYAATWKSGKIKLSSEHTDLAWVSPRELDRFRLLPQYRKQIRKIFSLSRRAGVAERYTQGT